MKSKKVYFAQSGILLAMLTLTGCMIFVKSEDSSVIQKSAVDRWNFLITHHAEKAYDYLSPGYRTTKKREVYAQEMNNRPVNWQSIKFVDQQCKQDECDVTLDLAYKVIINVGGKHKIESTSPIKEHWVREAGKWYFLPESNLKPVKVPESP